MIIQGNKHGSKQDHIKDVQEHVYHDNRPHDRRIQNISLKSCQYFFQEE